MKRNIVGGWIIAVVAATVPLLGVTWLGASVSKDPFEFRVLLLPTAVGVISGLACGWLARRLTGGGPEFMGMCLVTGLLSAVAWLFGFCVLAPGLGLK